MKKYWLATVSICLCCTLFGGAVGGFVADRFHECEAVVVETEPIPENHILTDTSVTQLATVPKVTTLTATQIYNRNVNCVVGIASETTYMNIFGQYSRSASSGTGFFIREDGYILTNHHVIENGSTYTVTCYDGTQYPATVVGYEEENDIAVLKIEANDMPTVTFGDSDNLLVGEDILTIGNPLGELTYTMTKGIVSALDRMLNMDEGVSIDMFQIDAAVNSGNSGGPAFNMYGQVIGVVSAKYASEAIEGLGFCIPINDALEIAEDLIRYGYVTGKPSMDIAAQTVTQNMAYRYGLVVGVYLNDVEEGGAADKAGLKAGDVIVKMDGVKITQLSELDAVKKSFAAGDTVSVVVFRDGEYLEMSLTFSEVTPETGVLDSYYSYYNNVSTL